VAAEYAIPSALAHFDPADLLDALATGILMLDAQLCPVYANVAAQDLLAFSLKMARGRPFIELLHEPEGLGAILRRSLATGETIADRELTVRPAGSPREMRTLDVTLTPFDGVTGRHLLLGGLIETACPVRILQGVEDPDVPWGHAVELVSRLGQDDVVLSLVKDGDHRLSRPEDLERLIAAVEEF